MREKEELSAELKAFENELATLVPENKRLNQGWMLFAAGLASAREGANVAARIWASAFGVMSVVAVSLLMVLLFRPDPPVKIIERVVHVPVKTHRRLPRNDPAAAGMPYTIINTQQKEAATKHTDNEKPREAADIHLDNTSSQRSLRWKSTGTSERVTFTVKASDKATVSAQPLKHTKEQADNPDKEAESSPSKTTRRQKADPKPQKAKTNGELLEEMTKDND